MSGGALIAGLLTQSTVFGNMQVAVISSIGQTVLPALVFLVIYKSIRKKETCYNLLKVGYWAFALNVFLGLYTFASGSTMIDVFTKRMSFNFLGPNIYASAVQLFVPISFFYIYNSNTAFKRILYYIAFVIIILSMIFTMSRGGALSLLIGFVLLGIINRQARSPLKKISAIFIITILAVLPYVMKLFSRFFNIFTNSRVTEFSTLIRTSAWKASLDGAIRYPLGIGGNQFPLLWADMGRFPSELVLHSHNLMLGILVEYGFISFISFLVFIGIIIKKLYNAALNLEVKKEKLFSATLLVSIITYIIMGTVSEGPRCHLRQNGDMFNHGIIFFYIFLAVGLKFVNLVKNEENSSVDSSA
ncbi:MAG: O-antigen ligase family protein [candidate division WOR-3 bacterium]|nr:O-antigen ligase family protein [candidate division WOR-3 bacterium]